MKVGVDSFIRSVEEQRCARYAEGCKSKSPLMHLSNFVENKGPAPAEKFESRLHIMLRLYCRQQIFTIENFYRRKLTGLTFQSRTQTAIHYQVRSSCVTGLIAQQESNRLYDFFNSPQTLHWYTGHLILGNSLWICGKIGRSRSGMQFILTIPHKAGPDECRTDRIDSNAIGCQIFGSTDLKMILW